MIAEPPPLVPPPQIIFATDEGIRAGTTPEKLGNLDTLVSLGMLGPVSGGPAGGAITAGNASQMSDGAAALLVVNDAGLAKLGSSVTPLARVHTLALAANDPVIMLDAPVPATQNALKRSGLNIDDIGLYEVNEAFAVVPMAWSQTVGADEEVSACVGGGRSGVTTEGFHQGCWTCRASLFSRLFSPTSPLPNKKLNVNGGACALGHPLGGTGAKLMTTLVHELVRREERYGLLSICEGGGTANATIIERC